MLTEWKTIVYVSYSWWWIIIYAVNNRLTNFGIWKVDLVSEHLCKVNFDNMLCHPAMEYFIRRGIRQPEAYQNKGLKTSAILMVVEGRKEGRKWIQLRIVILLYWIIVLLLHVTCYSGIISFVIECEAFHTYRTVCIILISLSDSHCDASFLAVFHLHYLFTSL